MIPTQSEIVKQILAMSDEELAALIATGKKRQQQEKTALGVLALFAAPIAAVLVMSNQG